MAWTFISLIKFKSFIAGAPSYVLGDTGFKDCEDQGMLNIMSKDECKDACEELKISLGQLRNNAICFKAGNGKCRQHGASGGAKNSRICKKEGILRIYTYHTNLRNINLSIWSIISIPFSNFHVSTIFIDKNSFSYWLPMGRMGYREMLSGLWRWHKN